MNVDEKRRSDKVDAKVANILSLVVLFGGIVFYIFATTLDILSDIRMLIYVAVAFFWHVSGLNGLIKWAKYEGRSRAWGLLMLLSLPGYTIAAIFLLKLPDKYYENERKSSNLTETSEVPSQKPAAATQHKGGGWVWVILIVVALFFILRQGGLWDGGGAGIQIKSLKGEWINDSPSYGLVYSASDGPSEWNNDIVLKLSETDPNTFTGSMQTTLRNISGPASKQPELTSTIGQTFTHTVSGTRSEATVDLYMDNNCYHLTFNGDYLYGTTTIKGNPTWTYCFSLKRK